MWRDFLGVIALCLVRRVHGSAPVGTITAVATQTRSYTSQVQLSYFEPVNCTLTFSEDVVSFGPHLFTKAATTVISNFVAVSQQHFTFQVSSTTNDNVTLSVAAGQVQDSGGTPNNATAVFYFQFYAYAPSVTLQLDGFPAHTTAKESNIAYLLFNSTTQYDSSLSWFNATYISFTPSITITDFAQVNDKMYRFRFSVPRNESYPGVTCVPFNAAPQTPMHTIFACSLCERPSLMCQSLSMYPPKGIANMEFPFSLNVKSIPELGLSNFSFNVVYDTLWPYVVSMVAPHYARDPFLLTITWSEPLTDLVAVQPTFDASGPPVDQDLLKNNLTVLSTTSFRLAVAPKATGILKISINGTQASVDLAGNTNDYFRNPNSRTGAIVYVTFSAGPPLPGTIAFQYERPRLDQEYPIVTQSFGFQTASPPSLTVSWSGFTTAVLYDTWIQWGQNMSTPEVKNLNATQYKFEQFSALLGAEYKVYIRAFNAFNESTTTSRIFLFPKFHINADANSKDIVTLPDMLSPSETRVSLNVLVTKNTFLSLNQYKVLTFGSVNKSAGDQDACRLNSPTTMCTDMNFHMEVPASQFVVFRKPITLQFIFGRNGWPDLYFRPRLRYWEAHDDIWRDVVGTCPQDQVFDRWNELHRIYEISVCHLSQFAVFKDFEPAAPTTAAPPPPRPESYTEIAFWIILGGSVILGVVVCCVCYFVFANRNNERRTSAYKKELGIKPVSERLPSRRPVGNRIEPFSLQDLQDPEQEEGLLALPAPYSASALALPEQADSPRHELPALEYFEYGERRGSEERERRGSEPLLPVQRANSTNLLHVREQRSYQILMPAKGWAKSRSYLRDLWTATATPGGHLRKIMESVDFHAIDYVQLAQHLFSIKVPGVPRIFAENALHADGNDFSLRELSLLGDISVAVGVTIFDNGAFADPVMHPEPFEGTLIYTCGTLMLPDQASADWQELVTNDLTIDKQAYFKLYERRLVPCFQYANDHAATAGRQALITIPALGCDQFAGRFKGTLGEMLGDVLQKILETHGGKWPNIHVVYFDALTEGYTRREIVEGTTINFIVLPFEANGPSGRSQLCHPRDYEGAVGGISDDFSMCDLFSFVAWDRVSWPGNHYWGGNRETDDGIKTAASDAMYKLSGVQGKYDAARKQYMPPAPYKTWSDVVIKNQIKLDVSSLQDDTYDPNGPHENDDTEDKEVLAFHGVIPTLDNSRAPPLDSIEDIILEQEVGRQHVSVRSQDTTTFLDTLLEQAQQEPDQSTTRRISQQENTVYVNISTPEPNQQPHEAQVMSIATPEPSEQMQNATLIDISTPPEATQEMFLETLTDSVIEQQNAALIDHSKPPETTQEINTEALNSISSPPLQLSQNPETADMPEVVLEPGGLQSTVGSFGVTQEHNETREITSGQDRSGEVRPPSAGELPFQVNQSLDSRA